MHKQEIMSSLSSFSRGQIYQYVIDKFEIQYYLTKSIDDTYKKNIAKIRLSSHNLNIESGRYTNEARNNRKCVKCNHEDLEDEFHFLFKCPFYSDLREYIKTYYCRRPSVFKMIQLLSTKNLKELRNLGKYIESALKRRNSNNN